MQLQDCLVSKDSIKAETTKLIIQIAIGAVLFVLIVSTVIIFLLHRHTTILVEIVKQALGVKTITPELKAPQSGTSLGSAPKVGSPPSKKEIKTIRPENAGKARVRGEVPFQPPHVPTPSHKVGLHSDQPKDNDEEEVEF